MTQMVKDLLSFFYNGEAIIEWLVIKSSVVACRLAEYDIIFFLLSTDKNFKRLEYFDCHVRILALLIHWCFSLTKKVCSQYLPKYQTLHQWDYLIAFILLSQVVAAANVLARLVVFVSIPGTQN